MTPSDQMSARVSTFFDDRICSGDIYSGEPRRLCDRVSAMCVPSSALDTPKSSTFTSGSPLTRRVRNRFAGLRSRWMIFAAWASAMASMACST